MIAQKSAVQAIKATTFTPLYDAIEDRIRLCINYKDYHNRIDFMITRKFIIKMIPTIEEYLDRFYPTLQEEIQKIQSTSSSQTPQGNVNSTDQTDLNLYKQEGILLREIKINFFKESQKSLLILLGERISTEATLDAYSLYKIMAILKKTIPHYEWGISPNF